MDNLDLYLAFALLLGVAIVFVGSRVGILPKKSIPLVIGAIVGLVGVEVLRDRRARALKEHLKELEDRIKKRDAELAQLEKAREISRRELDEARGRLDLQLAAAMKQTMLIETRNKAERARIDVLDLPSTIAEYRKMQAEELARAPGGP